MHVIHTDSSAGEMRADGEAATGVASGKRLEDASTRHLKLFHIVYVLVVLDGLQFAHFSPHPILVVNRSA